jgi:hypothetical protein
LIDGEKAAFNAANERYSACGSTAATDIGKVNHR